MNSQNISLPSDEAIIRRIVRSVQKAVEEDAPEFYQANPCETMNYARNIRGDLINNNLRNFVVSDSVLLHPFKRGSWDGRILIDTNHHITYAISTFKNLKAIIRKEAANRPNYQQTLLANQNGDLEGRYIQLSMLPESETFDEETLIADYLQIVPEYVAKDIGYRHYIIAYEYKRHVLYDIKLELLDKKFRVVNEISLNGYIKPNFAQLTAVHSIESESCVTATESAKDLVALRPGIRPDIIALEDELKA